MLHYQVFTSSRTSFDGSVNCQTVFFPLNNCASWVRFRQSRIFRHVSPHARSVMRSSSSASTTIETCASIRCGSQWWTSLSRNPLFRLRVRRVRNTPQLLRSPAHVLWNPCTRHTERPNHPSTPTDSWVTGTVPHLAATQLRPVTVLTDKNPSSKEYAEFRISWCRRPRVPASTLSIPEPVRRSQ